MAADAILERPRLNRWRWRARRLSRRLRHGLRIGWRRPTAQWRALPDFIIIGAQKSGTSSLYAYLAAHPQMQSACWKEVHYFDRHYAQDLAWYRSHFPLTARLRRRDALTGEASPSYLLHPRAAERIAGLVPAARLIVLLRDPVARTVSNYWHQVKRGREQLPLEEALAAEDERLRQDRNEQEQDVYLGYNHLNFSYKKRSMYAPQLKRYYNYFDRDQIMVIKSENFFSDTQATFDRVTRHLGLRPWTLPDAEPRNTAAYPQAPKDVIEQLNALFRPHNRALYDLLEAPEAWW